MKLFHAVPLRARADGWTALRQARFIGYLAETRCVGEAARRVGMARETAYRLRTKPGAESFRAAWDAALGKSQAHTERARKVTNEGLLWRIESGLWQLGFSRGRFVSAVQRPDIAAVLSLYRRLDRGRPPVEEAGEYAALRRAYLARLVSTPARRDRVGQPSATDASAAMNASILPR